MFSRILKSTMLQCLYLDYSYRPGFVQTEFRSSGTHMFVCWRATEHSLKLWQSPLPGLSFTCAPFAVLMAAWSRGEMVSDSELGYCSWLVGNCKEVWVCLFQLKKPVQFSKWLHFSHRAAESLGSRSLDIVQIWDKVNSVVSYPGPGRGIWLSWATQLVVEAGFLLKLSSFGLLDQNNSSSQASKVKDVELMLKKGCLPFVFIMNAEITSEVSSTK